MIRNFYLQLLGNCVIVSSIFKERGYVSMNLKGEILSFLDFKKEYSLLTKVRYVYLKMCKVFSYDYRYLFCENEEKSYYYDKEFDAWNVTEFELVCSSWCKLAKSILDEMGGGLLTSISYDVLPHVFLIVEFDDYKIKMDPMKYGYDITRVKVGCSTHGFFDLNGKDLHLSDIDKEIQENEDFSYFDEKLFLLCDKLKRNHMYLNVPYEVERFHNEAFKEKMDLMVGMINTSTSIQRYDDTDRYFDLLNLKLMTEWERNKLHKHPFWYRKNEKWEILNLILLEQENELPLCYKMSERNNKFHIDAILYDEMDEYLENYEGNVKGLYRELTRDSR